ncbi:uncharacterized protein [Panulirus ornatus]|uniref:uncharacterized protein isoform X2 n=1 Tax=Panulirus ornatus TaxID=150431 RepID=UPI003A892C65
MASGEDRKRGMASSLTYFARLVGLFLVVACQVEGITICSKLCKEKNTIDVLDGQTCAVGCFSVLLCLVKEVSSHEGSPEIGFCKQYCKYACFKQLHEYRHLIPGCLASCVRTSELFKEIQGKDKWIEILHHCIDLNETVSHEEELKSLLLEEEQGTGDTPENYMVSLNHSDAEIKFSTDIDNVITADGTEILIRIKFWDKNIGPCRRVATQPEEKTKKERKLKEKVIPIVVTTKREKTGAEEKGLVCKKVMKCERVEKKVDIKKGKKLKRKRKGKKRKGKKGKKLKRKKGKGKIEKKKGVDKKVEKVTEKGIKKGKGKKVKKVKGKKAKKGKRGKKRKGKKGKKRKGKKGKKRKGKRGKKRKGKKGKKRKGKRGKKRKGKKGKKHKGKKSKKGKGKDKKAKVEEKKSANGKGEESKESTEKKILTVFE